MKQRVTTSGQSMIDLGDALRNVEEGKAGSIDSLVASAKNVIRDTGTAVRKEASFTLRRMLLPERWAGYLVNRDRGGLDENELRVASAVVRDLAPRVENHRVGEARPIRRPPSGGMDDSHRVPVVHRAPRRARGTPGTGPQHGGRPSERSPRSARPRRRGRELRRRARLRGRATRGVRPIGRGVRGRTGPGDVRRRRPTASSTAMRRYGGWCPQRRPRDRARETRRHGIRARTPRPA